MTAIKLPPMRVISFSKTTDAIIERRKTVTRRWGWGHVKVGDILRGIDKPRRNLKQPPSVTLCCVEVTRVERCDAYPLVDALLGARILPEYRAWMSIDAFCDDGAGENDDATYRDELAREGLPELAADQFVDILVSMAPRDGRPLTRIEFKYREDLFEAWTEAHR